MMHPQGPYYTGASQTLGLGHHADSSLRIRRIASIRVAGGLTAVVCCRGPKATDDCVTLSADFPLLATVVGLDVDAIHRVTVQSTVGAAAVWPSAVALSAAHRRDWKGGLGGSAVVRARPMHARFRRRLQAALRERRLYRA